jgi:hypothetical protein
MHYVVGSLILGAIVGRTSSKSSFRPILRSAIKNSIRAGRSVQNFGGPCILKAAC